MDIPPKVIHARPGTDQEHLHVRGATACELAVLGPSFEDCAAAVWSTLFFLLDGRVWRQQPQALDSVYDAAEA
eukprot:6439376-Pyramimonas_sp.AAC.1